MSSEVNQLSRTTELMFHFFVVGVPVLMELIYCVCSTVLYNCNMQRRNCTVAELLYSTYGLHRSTTVI